MTIQIIIDKGIQKQSSLDELSGMVGHVISHRIYQSAIRILSHLHNRRGIFETVEIETINRCNNNCCFCPANVNFDKRKIRYMEDDLYCKIIRDLASVGYNGRIAFHSNNEPFLDNNIVNRIKYARSACQKSHLFMYTNGTLLNDNLLDMVANSGLNHLVVDWYSDNLTLDSEIERMLRQTADVYSSRQQAFRISVYVRKKTEILSNRGGNAPNKMASAGLDHSLLMKMGCTLPFRQIVIRPSGKISLCCNDVFGEATAGDLNENHIVDVWNGAFFSKIREELMRNGRSGLSICRRCDVADIKIRRLFSAYYGDIVRLFL